MKCTQCNYEVSQSNKFCKNCGREIIIQRNNPQEVLKTDFFDISSKRSLLQAVLITILISTSFIEMYAYIDSEKPEFFWIVGFAYSLAFLVISSYKGLYAKTLIISVVAVIVAVLFGGIFAAPLFIWLITLPPSVNVDKLSLIKRLIISSYAKKGLIWTAIGSIVTVGTMFMANEGETYIILYGASLVGGYYLLKGAFHSLVPSSLDSQEEQISAKVLE